MSEQQPEQTSTDGVPSLDVPSEGELAFGALMDVLVTEDGKSETSPSGAPADPAPAGDGSAAPAGEGTPAPGAADVPPADGASGESSVAGGGQPADGGGTAASTGDSGGTEGAAAGAADPAAGGDVSGAGDRPASWTASASDLIPKLGEISIKLEENTAASYQQEALDSVRNEYPKYFEALDQHPRLLVGVSVPGLDGKDTEVLRDSADAAEWQEAVKTILVNEVRARANKAMEENSAFLSTVHSSIEMFQNNSDLIPHTKDFDVELANRFTSIVKGFELKDDEGKLIGWSIPVQPVINQIRSELVATRAANPAAPTPPAGEGAAEQKKPEDEPQAGLSSKAGNSSEQEDFSTLFGTIGLPNLRI